MVFIRLLLFLCGLCIGSFLNVIIDRFPRGESVLLGRSHCDYCHKKLVWFEMIPFFSFLYQKGKCRHCRKFIGFKYPIIELVTGIFFVYSSIFTGNFWGGTLFYYLVVVCACIVIFFTDLFYGIIPDVATGTLILAAGIYQINMHRDIILASALTGICSGVFFLLLYILTKGKGMGFGDVKLAFAIGFLCGFPLSILSFYVAFLTGALVAFILVIRKKKKLIGSTIPFGPFFICGTILTVFWGQILWQYMLRFL